MIYIYIYKYMIKCDNIGLNPVCTAAGVYILYNIYIYMHALWRFPNSWGYPTSSKSWMTTTCKPMVTWGSPIFEYHHMVTSDELQYSRCWFHDIPCRGKRHQIHSSRVDTHIHTHIYMYIYICNMSLYIHI